MSEETDEAADLAPPKRPLRISAIAADGLVYSAARVRMLARSGGGSEVELGRSKISEPNRLLAESCPANGE
jgi:hypothetical protein